MTIVEFVAHNYSLSRYAVEANGEFTKPNMNKYIKTGILGILISIIIHAGIAFTKGISFGEIFPLYFVWIFFTITGVGYYLEGKQEKPTESPVF